MAKANSNGTALVPAVGYVRRSTNKQEESLDVQRGLIEDFAAREGFRIIRWYVDDAVTGDSEARSQFQQMLVDAADGSFRAVLCRSLSRFSRFRPSRAAKYWDMLDAAGVRLVTVEDGEVDVDDFASFLKAAVDQHADHKFLEDISKLTIGGQVKSVLDGYVAGQPIPFGLDKLILDEQSQPRQRVKAGDRFCKPKTWRSIFVPSANTEHVATVRWIFETYANTDTGLRGIADNLNRRNIESPRGGTWHQGTIRDMLRNQSYIGNYCWNRRREGKYHHVDDGKATKRHRREISGDKATVVYNDPSAWIVRENSHEGIISQELFESVQAKLNRKALRHGTWTRRNDGMYLLSGLVTCGHCGGKMHGTRFTRRKNGKVYEYARYICSTYVCKGASQCGHHHIMAEEIHRVVCRKLQEALDLASNRDRLREAIEREARRRSKQTTTTVAQLSTLRKQLAKLDSDIKRAAERILRVPDELVDDLTAALATMKAERLELVAKLDHAERDRKPLDVTEAVDGALGKLNELDHVLTRGDSAAVREFLQRAVEGVTLHFTAQQHKKRTIHTFERGTIRLNRAEPCCQVLAVAGTGFDQNLTTEITAEELLTK